MVIFRCFEHLFFSTFSKLSFLRLALLLRLRSWRGFFFFIYPLRCRSTAFPLFLGRFPFFQVLYYRERPTPPPFSEVFSGLSEIGIELLALLFARRPRWSSSERRLSLPLTPFLSSPAILAVASDSVSAFLASSLSDVAAHLSFSATQLPRRGRTPSCSSAFFAIYAGPPDTESTFFSRSVALFLGSERFFRGDFIRSFT